MAVEDLETAYYRLNSGVFFFLEFFSISYLDYIYFFYSLDLDFTIVVVCEILDLL